MIRLERVLLTTIFSLTLVACGGEPEWVGVYEQCKERVAAESEKIKAVGAESDDKQSRALAESMGNMAINMAMTGCEMIRTSCEQDAEGPVCRAYLEQEKPR